MAIFFAFAIGAKTGRPPFFGTRTLQSRHETVEQLIHILTDHFHTCIPDFSQGAVGSVMQGSSEPLKDAEIGIRDRVVARMPNNRHADSKGGTEDGVSAAVLERGYAAREPDCIVRFVGVSKSFDGSKRVVDDLNLEIRRGEFLTMLGPSGSGKTTSLMMLAGFEGISSGDILIDGRSMRNVPPYRRNIGMVFQNYALFPHLTIAENLGFPLLARGMPRNDIRERVRRSLDMVQLTGMGERRPAQLSGGQQQRVDVARALIYKTSLVIMY